MIPSYVMKVDQIPLTPNGKVDRKALPEPIGYVPEEFSYEEAVTQTKKDLVNIWKTLLNADMVGTTDNFFEMGGHLLDKGKGEQMFSLAGEMKFISSMLPDDWLSEKAETIHTTDELWLEAANYMEKHGVPVESIKNLVPRVVSGQPTSGISYI